MSGPLGALARAAVAGRRFIAVTIAAPQLAGLAAHGGHVLGDILVLAAGMPAPPPSGRPTLVVRGAAGDIFAHVVGGFADALAAAGAEVARFLAAVDPGEAAIVVAYLPVPRDIFGGREVWAQDAAIARALEDKADGALAAALPTPPQRPLRWPCGPAAWAELQADLGAAALVVQALGRSGAGAGTRLVRTFAEAAARLPALGAGPLRAAPWIAGDPCNAMGLVPREGPPIALPPARQVIAVDDDGRPVYAGNTLEAGDFDDDERRAIAAEVRTLGASLRARGFTGPFGVDFLRTGDGRRLYHDLNPRMNGVVGLLAAGLGAPWVSSPLPVLLLARPCYRGDEAALLEAEVAAAAARTDRWRLLLSAAVSAPLSVAAAPAPGRWWIGREPLRLRRRPELAALDDDHAELQVTLAVGARFEAGERLVLGELTCTPALGRRLVSGGAAGLAALTRALLEAA